MGDIIVEQVRQRLVHCQWESVEVERTGRRDGYLVEIRINDKEWWISEDYIMRLAVKQPYH